MDIGGTGSVYISQVQPDAGSVDGASDVSYQVGTKKGSDGAVEDFQTMSESEVNALLAPYGIRFEQGVQKSVDGFEVTPAKALIVNNLTENPLPDVTGSIDKPEVIQQKLEARPEDMSAGALTWLALSQVVETSRKDVKMAKELRNLLQKGKFDAKKNSLKAQKEKIEAEKGAAWVQFGVQMAAAGVSLGSAGAAAGGRITAVTAMALNSASGVIPALGNAIDKQSGFAAEADKQDIKSKKHDIEEAEFDMHIDDAVSNYQESKQAMEKSIKLLEDHSQRQTDALNAILR